MPCEFCKSNPADDVLTLDGKPVCRVCAHNASNAFPLGFHRMPKGQVQLPCPMVDAENRVIPFGQWPNIDYS